MKPQLLEFECDAGKVIVNLQAFRCIETRETFFEGITRDENLMLQRKAVNVEPWTSYQVCITWKHGAHKAFYFKNNQAQRDEVYKSILRTLGEAK